MDASPVWEEFTTVQGKKYYYNKLTDQSEWTIPEVLKPEKVAFNSSSSVAVTPVIPVVNAPPNVLSESSSLESLLIPLGKTESSTSHGAPEALEGLAVQNIEEAIKGMSVDEKLNTSSLEEKIADATKQERKDFSKYSLKDAPLVESLLKDCTKQERKDIFKSLLKDSNVLSDWTWEQAIRVIISDVRLIALESKDELDETFNEYREQRKKEEEFKRMLEDSRELTASMTWSKAVAVFENDKRYKAVDRASDREDLFQSYCADQQKKYHEDKSRVEGALNLKKVTVLTTWTFDNFKAAIEKDIVSSLSHYNLHRVFEDLIKMEKEKEKEIKKRDRFAKDFTELLNNMEDITASSTWEQCHHLLKDRSKYRAISDEIIAYETFAHEIFAEHVAYLAEKAQKKRKREDEKARKEDKMKRKEKEKERLKKDDSDSMEHKENKKIEKEDRKRRKFHYHHSDRIRSREDASSDDSSKYDHHSRDRRKTRKDASSRDSKYYDRHSIDREKKRKDASSRGSRKYDYYSSDREKTRKDLYSSESDSERKRKKHKKDSRY